MQNDSLRKPTVLLADDEPGIRAILTYFLHRNGFEVIQARNGREAVAKFTARREDIETVLLDVNMPVQDGVSALGEIRRINPAIRAVLTSGMLRSEILRKYSPEPPWTFLPKPFGFGEIEALFPKLA